ncbi:MAG: PAS domain S-box protein, partial [Phycisphaerales bacterium]
RSSDLECEIQARSGRRVWVRSIGEAVRDPAGRIRRVQGAFQDITARKDEERRKRTLEERLARTLESMSDAFFALDRDWRFTYLNQEAERMLQRSRTDLLGRVIWEEFPEALGMSFEREYRRAAEERVSVTFEEYYPPLNYWFSVRAHPYDGGLAVYFSDITDRKRADLELRASEERFSLLSRATNDAIWDWNLATNALWWNEGFEVLFGFHRDEVESTIESWTSRIHPEDRDRILAGVYGAIEEHIDYWEGEYRFLRKDGSYAHVLDRGYILRDESARGVRMIGGMTDLTERKEAELRLAEQAALLDEASDAILVRDLHNRVLFWNRRAEEIYGWFEEEVLGQSVGEILYSDPAPLEAGTEAVLRDGVWSGEVEHRTKGGDR